MIRSIQVHGKLLALLLLILLIFTSCTDGGAAIFYSIEIEEKIKNRSLPDYLTAFSYATINNMYYLAGGGLYRWNSSIPSQEWSDMSLPSGWKYTWQVDSNGTDTVYVVLENSDGDSTALYTWDSTNSWQGSYAVGIGRPYRLWFADSRVYVATQETANETDKIYNYRLYMANNATNLSLGFSQVTVGGSPFVSSNKPVRDLAYDTDNTEVLFITSGGVYSGTGNTFNANAAATPSGRYLRNIYFSTTHSDIFISTGDDIINADGYVYRWDGSSLTGFSSVSDDPNDFGDISFGGTNYLVIGTEDGYNESADGSSGFSGESATIESSSEYDITDLSSSIVQGLFDGPGDIFFAMTSGNGLWRNTSGTWSRE